MVNTEIPNAGTLIDPVALERTKNDIVVRNRTLVERDFNEWYTSLLTCDKALILDKIPFPYEGWTLQNQCPEWYSNRPSKAKAQAEYEALAEKIQVINNIVNEVHKEGLELLAEFNRLNS